MRSQKIFPARQLTPPRSPQPNFQALWGSLVRAAETHKNDRFKAILTNHQSKQEYICRKLGVVSLVDVERVSRKLQKPIEPPKA